MGTGTFSRALKGWLAGCGTATAVIYIAVLGIVATAPGGVSNLADGGVFALLLPSLLVLVITCALTGIPAALVIWLTEKFRIRSFLFYGCAGGAIGILGQTLLFRSFSIFTWLFVAAGFLAGFDYWYVAGRHAGGEPASPVTAAVSRSPG
jgi:hypothetical protein